MKDIVVLATDPVGGDVAPIRSRIEKAGGTVLVGDFDVNRKELPRIDAIIANLTPVGAQHLSAAQKCQIVARLGVGVDSVDVGAASAHGTWVTNVPRYCTDEVAEHAIALMLSLQRRLRQSQLDLEAGVWNQLSYRGIHSAENTTVGVVGLGELGLATARKASAFGFSVIGFDPSPSRDATPETVKHCDLDELLAVADIVSLHVPLLPSTRHLISGERIAGMKRGAFLVNVARGGIVDERAMLDALDSGQLGGAALDAFETEPLGPDSPLLGRPDVIATPHIAFLSEESLLSLQTQAVDEVLRVLGGEAPLNPVNEVFHEKI